MPVGGKHAALGSEQPNNPKHHLTELGLTLAIVQISRSYKDSSCAGASCASKLQPRAASREKPASKRGARDLLRRKSTPVGLPKRVTATCVAAHSGLEP
mmetsp:Transcript_28962/g.62292  ORF Transcript_28962/g.62292 Transcript_28962/m.62292 type:complete len:99 (+) Transcript_28962:187-483(+)